MQWQQSLRITTILSPINRLRVIFDSFTKMSANLRGMRKSYHDKQEVLLESDVLPRVDNDPFTLFHEWFEVAKQYAQPHTEVNAVCLSTTTKEGKPSSRMVLLKSYDPINGFIIFTNYQSRKGKEIEENPNVALLFYWDYLSRQVRIEGRAKKVPPAESDEYYGQRPRMSQVSARISAQSQPVDSRQTLVKRQQEEALRWSKEAHISRPDFWGGFHIIPERFEFWQGQSDRLHDRFVFTRHLEPLVDGNATSHNVANCLKSTTTTTTTTTTKPCWSFQRLQP